MAKRKKKKSKGFAIFMVLYIILFAVGTFYGLKYLWGFMESYEKSRPINAVNAYMETVDEQYWIDATDEYAARVDTNIQSSEQCREFILDFLSPGVSYERDPANSNGESIETYMLRCQDKVVGKLVFTPTEYLGEYFPHIKEFRNDLYTWDCTQTEYYFDWIYTGACEQVVPTGYTVYLNGNPLGDEYVVEDNIEYEALEDLYDTMPELPHMRRYKVTGYVGELELTVKDPNGEPVDLDTFVPEELFTSNCSAGELDRLNTFVDKFVKAYVTFSSNVNKDTYNNKIQLQALIVADSSLYQRVNDAVEGLYWAHSKGDVIKSITLNSAIKLDDSRYYCDVTYILDTTGQEGTFSVTDNIRLVINDGADGLKVASMFTY